MAPSPRILAYLARRGRYPTPSMALTPVEHTFHVPPPDPVEPPPDVAVTPCDPWPAPYYLEGGLRRVKPYHYTYNTYCKERWRGRELLEIFLSEFRDREPEYYVSLPIEIYVHAGSVRVTDQNLLYRSGPSRPARSLLAAKPQPLRQRFSTARSYLIPSIVMNLP